MVRKAAGTQTASLCQHRSLAAALGHWGVPKSPGTAQLLQLAQSPGKASIKGCPEYRTTAEKFKASPVSFLQADPFRKGQETERALLKAKYIAGTSKITG